MKQQEVEDVAGNEFRVESNEYKKFTAQAKAQIKGEAFFESLVSNYSLPHHIVGLKDLGIDYICEWVYGDRPTGILYAVQVKTLSQENVQTSDLGRGSRNGLQKYRVRNTHLKIRGRTLQYWRGLGMPVFLFVIVYSESDGQGGRFDCYYKRFTPILTTDVTQEQVDFYKVNDGTTFLAFADRSAQTHGFARDLFVDLVRCYYSKGFIFYISPRTIGLQQFPDQNAVFEDVYNDYRQIICRTYENTKMFLETVCENQTDGSSTEEITPVPSEEPPEDESSDQ
jgi:hypothetical protein